VRNFGEVLEHPANSHAWEWFGLAAPQMGKGWQKADDLGGWTCYVEQGHYGHESRKPTWLYAVGAERPKLNWTKGECILSVMGRVVTGATLREALTTKEPSP
jgi:hypothetical protein